MSTDGDRGQQGNTGTQRAAACQPSLTHCLDTLTTKETPLKNLIRMPYRDGLTLGVEMNEMPMNGLLAATRPTHLYVHRGNGEYLGFVCFACHGDNGKWRAETDPDTADPFESVRYFSNLDQAVTYLEIWPIVNNI